MNPLYPALDYLPPRPPPRHNRTGVTINTYVTGRPAGGAGKDEATRGETKPGQAVSRQDYGRWAGQPEAKRHRGAVGARSRPQLKTKCGRHNTGSAAGRRHCNPLDEYV
ncbi:unnamed protein product [Tuber melanosporum]|uniref:(Perigord truffle) hypothetical protein n=1 Tax=Tuber melanosporum (strain Mel28) TaxID=656061 RepID=D5GIF4_TUBMM|nr:uncharacterized protein GSTUM_00008473001 [Tuber melanosporum]CAZ84297.1 unnamed protein product [Tuber melanosporum]